MKYEVITLKKKFRYHATVMATPDRWWEKYLLFKKPCLLQYQGRDGLWVDHEYNLAPEKVSDLIDIKFAQEFDNPFAAFFKTILGAFERHFQPQPLPPPFIGKRKKPKPPTT